MRHDILIIVQHIDFDVVGRLADGHGSIDQSSWIVFIDHATDNRLRWAVFVKYSYIPIEFGIHLLRQCCC
ncbi:hypothetical protein D3C84_1090580 [compost metagenome]